MKKIIILLFLIFLLGFGIYYYKNSDIENNKIEVLVQNDLNNPSLSNNIEVKDKNIRLINILSPEKNQEYNITSIDNIKKYIEISKTLVNNKEYSNIIGLKINTTSSIEFEGKVINNIQLLTKPQIEYSISNIVINNNSNSPIIKDFSKLELDSSKDNMLEFTGDNIGNIDKIKIGDIEFIPSINGNTGYIGIDKNTFNKGEFEINIISKNNKISKFDKKLKITQIKNNSKIIVDDIIPSKVNNKDNVNIVLQGNGFDKVIGIQLNNNIILKETHYNIISDKILNIIIPSELEAGEYNFNIMTTDGIFKTDKFITIIK